MSSSLKMNNESVKARTYRETKSTTYKAPTPGLEHIVFEYGKQMKPGSFKTMMESMAEHMAGVLKKGDPEAAKAIKKQQCPKYKEPNEPKNGSKKDDLKFAVEYDCYMKRELNLDETTGRIFEKLSSHCSPNMKKNYKACPDGKKSRMTKMESCW